MHKKYKENKNGTDYVVGDIHGAFTLLKAAIIDIGFDPSVDRLFSAGDLVDRGPESELCTEWLNEPWFHAVRGNHEQMAIDAFVSGDYDHHVNNGGMWFYSLPYDERAEYADYFQQMPMAITLESGNGSYGIVHAECCGNDWGFFIDMLSSECDTASMTAIWSRSRISREDRSVVSGVSAVLVGHTVVNSPMVLGNTIYLDTEGWKGDKFAFFNAKEFKVNRA